MSDISSTKSPTKAFVGANAKDANAGQNSFAMRVQKKVLSKLSKRGVVRILANDRVNSLMDTLYALLKFHYDSQTAEKVVKNIIKLIFKLGAMDREHTLNEVQSQMLVTIERELRQLALTLQSFQAISYSFNLAFLLKLFDNLRYAILSLAEQTLSDKSSRRVNVVFDQLGHKDFLKQLGLSFPANENSPRSSPQFALLVQKFTDDLAALMCAAEGSNDNMAMRNGNVR